MQKLPLMSEKGHLFTKIEEGLWLIDTGAPMSFGSSKEITIDGKSFNIEESYMGFSPETLSEYVGLDCVGLIGADILNEFDHIFDCPKEIWLVSSDEKLTHNGSIVQLSEVMGIPVIGVNISGLDYNMFFDTGAQISYFQDQSLKDFPYIGTVDDFYPGFGQFQTETYQVEASISGVDFSIACGTLPGLLGATLMMADTQGIVGNQIVKDRSTGYFPKRNQLCL